MNTAEQTPELVDIGVNLAPRSFQADRDQIIQRAAAAGVRTMVVTGTSVAASQEAVRIAREYPGRVFATAGVHPHDSRHGSQTTIPELRHLALAEELQMPLFLHERDARERFCQILRTARKRVPAVIHCFTGSGEDLNAYLDMGLHIGITGWICDERRGTHLSELVKRVPLDRLMLETDAPFLLPRTMPKRPKENRNEPAFLPFVLQAVADCLPKGPAEVASATTKTAREFFGLP